MSRILVAGGAGFIGSHLVDALIDRGDEVVCIDNLSTGRISNLGHLVDNKQFVLVQHDITIDLLDLAPFSQPFDKVLNFASPASPDDFGRIPVEILLTGSIGTRNLLNLAERDGATFMQASTSEVYGDPLVSPQPETYWGNVSSTGPRSCYDEAKRFGEALTMAYRRTKNLDIRIVRIFNTYGERMRPNDGRVVTNFITQALRGEPLSVYGDGGQKRSFCHVSDEVAGILALLDSNYQDPMNIGNPGEVTMFELAQMIVDVSLSSSEIHLVPMPPEREGDPLQREPDITLARQILGWQPKISLRDGLMGLIQYFRTVELQS